MSSHQSNLEEGQSHQLTESNSDPTEYADDLSHRHGSNGTTSNCCVLEENHGEEVVEGTSDLVNNTQKMQQVSSAEESLKTQIFVKNVAESAIAQDVGESTTDQVLVASSDLETEISESNIPKDVDSDQDDEQHSTLDILTTVHSLEFWEPLVCELQELTKDGYRLHVSKNSESDSNQMLETIFTKMEELREGFLALDNKVAKLQSEKIAAKPHFMTSMASFMAQVYKALSNGYQVQCLLDWQLLLVTWTNCCEEMGKKVISENIHIEMIKMLLDLPKSATYQELLSRLIHMGMFVLLTLIEQKDLRHHFKSCNYTDILISYLHTKNFSIAKLARISTAMLHRQLDHSIAEKHLALSTRDVKIILKILSDAVLSEDENKEFWHYFSKSGLIDSLKNFSCLPSNSETIVKSDGVQVVRHLLQKNDTDLQEATLRLLWQLNYSCHDVSIKGSCDLDCLQELTNSENEDVKCLATCLLTCFSNCLPDGPLCTLYVSTAYKNEMFEDCVEFCQRMKQVHPDLNSDIRNKINLFQGKSIYHIFTQDLIYLRRNPAGRLHEAQKSACYRSIKQVIQLLGSVLDSGCIDEEGSQMLDTAMMMLLSESRNLKGDLPRCLLCRKKGKLARSHICPKAILSDFAKACGTPDSGKAFFTNWPWQKLLEGNLKSSGEITIRILCSSCESLLSKDESLFLPNFFRKLYNVDNPSSIEEEQCIEYESWLYQFCVGVVFRGLVLQYSGGRDEFLNEDEVYTLFLQCRKVLLNHKAEKGPCVSIYVAPTKGDPSEIGSSLINTVIHHPFHFFFTHKQGIYGSHQMFLHALSYTFQIGIILITINFPMAYWPVDPSRIISPTCGVLSIPANTQRHGMIPGALWETLLASAMQLEKEVMEQPRRTIDMLPLEELLSVPPTSYMEGILSEATKSVGVGKGSFLRGHPKIINLMPPLFFVNHPTFKNTSGSLELPHNHKVLLHLDIAGENPQEGNTAFIAVGEDLPDYGPENPYLIFHQYQPGLQQNTAFIFSPQTYEFVRYLPERNPKRFLDESESSNLLKKSKEIISLVLQSRGFRNYQSLLYWLHSKRGPDHLDMKCRIHCWYCQDLCEICLKPTILGPAMSDFNDAMLRFCSEECICFYKKKPKPQSTTFTANDQSGIKVPPGHKEYVHLYSSGKLEDGGCFITSTSLCEGNGSEDFPKGKYYVNYYVKTPQYQCYYEYFISEYLLPLQAILYKGATASLFDADDEQNIIETSSNIITGVITSSGGTSVSHLLELINLDKRLSPFDIISQVNQETVCEDVQKDISEISPQQESNSGAHTPIDNTIISPANSVQIDSKNRVSENDNQPILVVTPSLLMDMLSQCGGNTEEVIQLLQAMSVGDGSKGSSAVPTESDNTVGSQSQSVNTDHNKQVCETENSSTSGIVSDDNLVTEGEDEREADDKEEPCQVQ